MALNINAILQKKGITQAELADKMKISRVQMNRHVNGNPTVAILEKISAAIGCHITELFDAPTTTGGIILENLPKFCSHCGNKINYNIDTKVDE